MTCDNRDDRALPRPWFRSHALLLMALLLLLHGAGYATRISAAPLPETGSGTLLYRSETSPAPVPAPLQSTEVTLRVAGMVARATVVQTFRNPGSEWVEGVYVFPLPESAAVDHLRLKVDERVIEGQIKEREEAKRTYTAAAASGQRAALVEQERPNLFTTSVANIPPGASITVELEYQQTVHYEDGEFSLRFPMVVGPRYIPGVPVGPAKLGWSPPTPVVTDAPRITPPVRRPDEGPVNPVSLTVELAPGFPVTAVQSPNHPVVVGSQSGNRYRVQLADGPVPADRDFVLRWWPKPGAEPRTALFQETEDGGGYALVQVLPPWGDEAPKPPPREVIFILDVSGSMHGASIDQAKSALTLALSRLGADDTFNLIAFSDRAAALYPVSKPADGDHLSEARHQIAKLEAEGGTEMLPALRLALESPADEQRLRQVVFLTDGAVGDEARLFEYIRRHAGAARLFTVGIGSAPNSFFMTKAAAFGRGTFTYVGAPEEVAERMGGLLRKLESPQLTDLALTAEGEAPELLPERIPDLYRGEPLVLALHWRGEAPRLHLTGRLAGQPWTQELDLAKAEPAEGVGVLWARRRIDRLMDAHRAAPEDERDGLQRAVVATALHHHLVSRFTSLVAVDVTPVRPGAEPLHTRAVETNLPAGWDYGHVFGLPQTATPAPLFQLLGALLLLAGWWWRRRWAS